MRITPDGAGFIYESGVTASRPQQLHRPRCGTLSVAICSRLGLHPSLTSNPCPTTSGLPFIMTRQKSVECWYDLQPALDIGE